MSMEVMASSGIASNIINMASVNRIQAACGQKHQSKFGNSSTRSSSNQVGQARNDKDLSRCLWVSMVKEA